MIIDREDGTKWVNYDHHLKFVNRCKEQSNYIVVLANKLHEREWLIESLKGMPIIDKIKFCFTPLKEIE